MPEPGRHAWGQEKRDNKLTASPWCQQPSTSCASHLCSFLEWFPKPPFHFGDERNRQGLSWSRHPPPQSIHCRRKSVSLPPLSILSLLSWKTHKSLTASWGAETSACSQPSSSTVHPAASCFSHGRAPFPDGSSHSSLFPPTWPGQRSSLAATSLAPGFYPSSCSNLALGTEGIPQLPQLFWHQGLNNS